MNENNKKIAQAYYTAMGKKDIATLATYLHPDIQFVGPLAKSKGKDAMVTSVENFTKAFNGLAIITCFASENQAMVVYELEFPAPIGTMRSAALLTFHERLITHVELFYDARPFVQL